jgi:hypothetical protein
MSKKKVTIAVHRKSNITMPCSVSYETVDATAKAGERYVHSSGVSLIVGLFLLCIRSLLAMYEVSFDTYAYLRGD